MCVFEAKTRVLSISIAFERHIAAEERETFLCRRNHRTLSTTHNTTFLPCTIDSTSTNAACPRAPHRSVAPLNSGPTCTLFGAGIITRIFVFSLAATTVAVQQYRLVLLV